MDEYEMPKLKVKLSKFELEESFINSKVSLLATKSSGDAYSVAKSNLPS